MGSSSSTAHQRNYNHLHHQHLLKLRHQQLPDSISHFLHTHIFEACHSLHLCNRCSHICRSRSVQCKHNELNGILRHYLVTLTSILPTETQNISSSQVYITITGLRPNTQYTCIVSAETVGSGPPTPAQQILTPEDGILNMKLRTYPYCPQ